MASAVSSRGVLIVALLFASSLVALAAPPRCVLYGVWNLSDKQKSQSKKSGKSTKDLPNGKMTIKEYKGSADESFDMELSAEVTGFSEPPVAIVFGKGKFSSSKGLVWKITRPWSSSGTGAYKLDFKLTGIEKVRPRGGSGSVLEVLQAVDKGVVSDFYSAVVTKSSHEGLIGGGFVKGFPNIMQLLKC